MIKKLTVAILTLFLITQTEISPAINEYRLIKESNTLKVSVKTLDKKHTTKEYKEKVLEILSLYPEHLQHRILLALGEVIFTDELTFWQSGTYTPSRKRGQGKIHLDIYNDLDSSSYLYSLVHELAHALDYSYEKTDRGRKLSDNQEWIKIYSTGILPSRYSKTNKTEGLAEAIMIYIITPERLWASNKEMYKYVEKLFKEPN